MCFDELPNILDVFYEHGLWNIASSSITRELVIFLPISPIRSDWKNVRPHSLAFGIDYDGNNSTNLCQNKFVAVEEKLAMMDFIRFLLDAIGIGNFIQFRNMTIALLFD